MKREIKFRSWDKKRKEWHTGQPITNSYLKNLEESQYIGLKDKNKKEIYEGDIMQCIDDSGKKTIFVCEYGIARRIMQSGIEVDIPSFYFLKDDGKKSFPIVHNYLGKHDLEIIEIIGNIYENPELIKQQSPSL